MKDKTEAVQAGMSTARVSTAADAREIRREQEDAARSYLTRTGNDDLLPMLGLGEGT